MLLQTDMAVLAGMLEANGLSHWSLCQLFERKEIIQ
jgi:hypothetical protein